MAANGASRSQGATPVRAGTYVIDGGDVTVTGWHCHDFHQLEHAFEGVAELETETDRYLLPPQQVVWIPAGVKHCSTRRGVRGVSVFFDPRMGLPTGDRVRILAAAPVIKEMLRYAARWPISRAGSDPTADTFFRALANVVIDWLDQETPLRLPTARRPVVVAAMAFTERNLSEDLAFGGVCRAVGMSERSMRRVFADATGMSWRRYVHESRLLKSMALLAEADLSILGVALAVGFHSVSAFGRAFTNYTGETPSAYRHRIQTTPVRNRVYQVNAASDDAAILQWSQLLSAPA
jgi:AraC-like DNA-binding protein